MGNELKIVLIVIAIYLVLGFQNLVNTSVFLIPYELNPLILLGVAAIIFFGQIIRNQNPSFKAVYFTGILFYSFLSTRTLSLFSNYFDYQIFNEVAKNEFTALIVILVFYSAIFTLIVKIRTKSYFYYSLLLLLILSFIGALANNELLQIICFTAFVLVGVIYNKIDLNNDKKELFLPILYQLFLFIILENTYFVLVKYW